VFQPNEPLLPVTGPQSAGMAAAGATMLAIGGVVIWRTRRRPTEN
jgi:LPXTG-motif cell wall-anchored protein